jgi:uncharacterized protein YcnI
MIKSAKRLRIALATLALVVTWSTLAFAHAVVYPKAAQPGAYERYVLRVPNERDIATTRVEIRFPAEVTVVSFAEVQGWRVEVVTDSAKRIVGAVWTGQLAPQRFIELPFIAVNPKVATTLVWPTFQTYADGERVEWTGAEGSEKPASVTSVGPAAASPAGRGAAPAIEDEDEALDLELVLSAGAMLIAIIALIAALRNRASAP